MNASAVVTYGIGGIALFVACALIAGVARAARSATLSIAVLTTIWLTATAHLARGGTLARFDSTPPPWALLLVAMFIAAVTIGFSSVGQRLSTLPVWALVGIQGFRLPLELVMHRAAEEGVMPVQMSYSGCNFDVVTGATAFIVAAMAYANSARRWMITAWNALGILTLTVIITVAVASTPMFAAFGATPERLNAWVFYFPFVWLPTACVLFAIAGHIILTRHLLQTSAPTSP